MKMHIESKKPQEPVYEWQWLHIVNGSIDEYSTNHCTEEEYHTWEDNDEWFKIEETKRLRERK